MDKKFEQQGNQLDGLMKQLEMYKEIDKERKHLVKENKLLFRFIEKQNLVTEYKKLIRNSGKKIQDFIPKGG